MHFSHTYLFFLILLTTPNKQNSSTMTRHNDNTPTIAPTITNMKSCRIVHTSGGIVHYGDANIIIKLPFTVCVKTNCQSRLEVNCWMIFSLHILYYQINQCLGCVILIRLKDKSNVGCCIIIAGNVVLLKSQLHTDLDHVLTVLTNSEFALS